MSFTIYIEGAGEGGKFFRELPRAVDVKLKARLKTTALTFQRNVRADAAHGRQGKGGLSGFGSGLQRATGQLAGSVKIQAGSDGLSYAIGVQPPGARYAAIQEYGGTIRPKRGSFLRVPLPAARRASGAPNQLSMVRQVGTRVTTKGVTVKVYQTGNNLPTRIVRSRRGNLLVQARTGAKQWTSIAVLKREVTLRPRWTWRKNALTVVEMINKQIDGDILKLISRGSGAVE